MDEKRKLILRTKAFLESGLVLSSREQIFLGQWALTKFLQDNGLTKRQLALSLEDIDEHSAIWSDDLTPLGLEVMRKSLYPWLGMRERGGDPMDVRIMERALAKLRKG